MITNSEYKKSPKKERPKNSNSQTSLMVQTFSLIRNKIQQDSTLFTDRQRLKNMLSDCFAQNLIAVNLLMTTYDENVGNCLKKYPELDDKLLQKFRSRLVSRHGISEDNADWAVSSWYSIFNRKISANISKNGEVPKKQSLSHQSPQQTGLISIPNFDSGNSNNYSNKPAKVKNNNSKNSRSLDLLKRAYKQNFDSPKWSFWNIHSLALLDFQMPDIYWEQMPNDSALQKIALNVVCHGKYSERDIIHLRINTQCDCGWALTYDSFCTGGNDIGDNIFKYSNISSGSDCMSKILKLTNYSITMELMESVKTEPLVSRLTHFLDAAKKIVAPNNLSNKSNLNALTKNISIIENSPDGQNNNKNGYYHNGSWWSMW